MKKEFEISYSFGYVYDKSKIIAMYPVGTTVINEEEYEMEVEVEFLKDGIDSAFKDDDIKLANDTMKPLEMFLMKPNKIIPFVESIRDNNTKEELNKMLEEFDEEYDIKNNYIEKGYKIIDFYDVFKNVVDYIPQENLENLNILKVEYDNFKMNDFLNKVKNNLDEVMDSSIIPISMKKSDLTPRLFVKSNDNENNSFYVPFAVKSGYESHEIICANGEIISDENIDIGDLEISITRDAGYIIEKVNNILTFKISNFNSKTENNNQITQVVDYAGKIKSMMIEFLNLYIKHI